MPFTKGNDLGKGRPKGKTNKVTEEAKVVFLQVMEGEMDKIQDSLQVLRENSDEKYLKALSSMMPYFMPKMVETEVTFNEPVGQPSWFDEVLDRTDQEDENLTK
tara:strand:- start:618 stop:929 length:312 start_codon:yes stop_codon:yes gene_type:complete